MQTISGNQDNDMSKFMHPNCLFLAYSRSLLLINFTPFMGNFSYKLKFKRVIAAHDIILKKFKIWMPSKVGGS